MLLIETRALIWRAGDLPVGEQILLWHALGFAIAFGVSGHVEVGFALDMLGYAWLLGYAWICFVLCSVLGEIVTFLPTRAYRSLSPPRCTWICADLHRFSDGRPAHSLHL